MLRFAWFSAALFAVLLPTIADVNILLPPKITHPVEYRLQVGDGCFKWSWDHHDVLSVIPDYNAANNCSTSARVRSIAPFSGRKETAVYAADVYTGAVIRRKVFIDNVSRIQIFHNPVKLDLNGFATLRACAFDSGDNMFSSLVGLQFMWELKPEIDGLPHHLLHVPLKDSPLSDCSGLCGDLNIQIKLEDNGVFSDLFVVKGIGIGHESVSVHLLEPQFNHLADKIALTVVDAMSLEPPSPVFVLVGASFQFTLKVIRANALQVVTLPSPHHKWSIWNSSVAEVDPSMGFTLALNLGLTTVRVEDTRGAGNTHLSSLNVVLPHKLYLYKIALSISGDPIDGIEASSSMSRWYIISGHQYRIQMKVFSPEPDAREIYITESDDLRLHDEQSEYWTTFLTSEDIAVKHDWHNSRILKATSQGMGKLAASLRYVGGHHEMHVLKVAQEVHVCGQVKFSLERVNGTILLPWAPNIYQELELKATGGCAKAFNDYKWFSSDISTLSVSTSGVVQAKKPGKATVKVVSIFDSLNCDEVVIEVSIPSNMIMLQNLPVETVVGSLLHAAIMLKASSGACFYKCDAFHPFVKWKAASSSFVVLNETEESLVSEQLHNSVCVPPCAWAHVYASAPGQTMLHATFSKDYHDFDKSFHRPVVLKSSSRIKAYPPLTLHQIGDGNQFGGYWFDSGHADASYHVERLERLYLIPGTSLDVLLLGGPEPCCTSFDFMETVEILGDESGHIKDKVHVQQVSQGYQSVYSVSCGSLGLFKLVFKRGNLVGDNHPLPAVADVTLSLSCSFPSSIALIVDEPVNKRDTIRSATLADRSTGRIHATVANGRTIRIAAVGISSSGEAFANSSSISLKWELSSCERLACWDDAHESERSKSSWERFLALKNDSGQCVVRATVDSSNEVLTDAIRLELVSTLGVNPEFNLLYFNPNAKVNLSITGGSCWWEAVVNDSQVLEIIQPRPGLQCLQLTVSPRGFGTAHLTVSDVGLTPPMAASAVVQVADVDWIKIVSGDEISLMEGQSQFIDLTAGINDGSTFNSDQFAFMNINVFIEDDVVELLHNDGILSPGGGCVNVPSFKIRAKHLGMTTLFASVRQHSGREILSKPIKIEVFEPLRIHPHVIFLVPGASYQLTVKGGPTIGAHVEYVSMDDGVATVDKSSGHLFGISPGNTISVGAHVYPQSPVLHQGSSLNFSIEGIQFPGRWHSANESVVSVDMQSGKAKAVGIGSTLVFFYCPTTKLQMVVTVLPGNALSIEAPKEEILTNVPYPRKGYRFSVRFSDTDNQLDPKGDRKGVSHDCKVDPSFIGYAKPWMDLDTGYSYCLFFPLAPEDLGLSAPRFLGTRPYLSVSVNASLREASHVSGSVSAIFIGGFSIMEMDKGLMQLNLTPDSKKTVITILGNTDVEIHCLERDSIKISLIREEEFGIGGRAQYEVKALGEGRFKVKLIVALAATGQREEIDVNYEPHNQAFEIIVTDILGLLVLILATRLCVYYTTNRTQPYVAPPAAGFGELQTPLSEQSPQTPELVL